MSVSPMRWTVLVLVVFLSLLTSCADVERVSSSELLEHVAYLASDELQGRAPGTVGIGKAEQYISDQFSSYGLLPLSGKSSYFLEFAPYQGTFDPDASSLRFVSPSGTIVTTLGVDFKPFWFSELGSISAELVFAGYGITAPEYDYDDYRDIDVAGKAVLIMRHEPEEQNSASRFNGRQFSQHAYFQKKIEVARSHGAVAMILFTDPLNHTGAEDLRVLSTLSLNPIAGKKHGDNPFLSIHISRETAGLVVQPFDFSLLKMQRAVDDGTPPSRYDMGETRVDLVLNLFPDDTRIQVRNVAGIVPGSDPALQSELIVVGAHHDHLGSFAGQGDTVYNGADDNASGTAALLEIAEQFAKMRKKPKRSVVFVTFSSEEKGLIGSQALVESGYLDMNSVVFMVNLDMIGRNPEETIQVSGDGFTKGLRVLVEELNESYGLPLSFSGTTHAANSDHHVFHERGVPYLMFFSGEHDDYHGLGDHGDKLNYSRMESIAKLAFDLVEKLASMKKITDE